MYLSSSLSSCVKVITYLLRKGHKFSRWRLKVDFHYWQEMYWVFFKSVVCFNVERQFGGREGSQHILPASFKRKLHLIGYFSIRDHATCKPSFYQTWTMENNSSYQLGHITGGTFLSLFWQDLIHQIIFLF